MKNKMMKPTLITIAFLATFGAGFAFSKMVPTLPETPVMKKVTGIGGIFFKCRNPQKLKEWYSKNLGLQMDKYGTTFEWRTGADSTKKGYTQWSAFKETTKYFEPSTKDFMINYRVDNLQALVELLKADSVTILDTIESVEYGKFVHILDIEGNKIELWEPIDTEFSKIVGGVTK